MRVSTKVEYGMMALADIALYSENGNSVSAVEIAERQDISKKYLEQILPLLKQAGFIKAHKGLRGGYTLACNVGSTKMTDVLNALDTGILEEMEASEAEAPPKLRGIVNKCLWGRINRSLRKYTDELTLSDFLQNCKEEIAGEWDLYVI
ncbi:MAG: Rrf2 family transcriptional regulator [Lachnospiraceae bacterium]|nr:Rrf2 family transcriptional regulator [Lachnospiraceae bacterium]